MIDGLPLIKANHRTVLPCRHTNMAPHFMILARPWLPNPARLSAKRF